MKKKMYNNHSSKNHLKKKKPINSKFLSKGITIILKSQVNLVMKTSLVIFNILRERWYRSLETIKQEP